jgi:signal transduction histidine kinase
VKLERQCLELGELLEHVAEQVEETTGREIPVHASAPLHLWGDPMRLTELFLNLLENATQYTPPEGSITVEATGEGKNVIVSVRDTGVGIPSEHLSHIFERFYRVDQARAREAGGTGLGLSIARWIVESHGGTIWAESELGQWTTMTVTLPSADEEAR